MKPLIVLLGVFCLSLLGIKLATGEYQMAIAARSAMSAMLLFTAIGHFAFTRGMSLMLPQFIPFKTQVVYLTGILEILFAIGLFLPTFRMLTAVSLVIFMILILPANIYAAIKNLEYQKGTYDGNGPKYLWFRIPLQLLFIIWVYFSAILN